nr:uncharacterized protein LOC108395407 isoform X2 [Manis javanica]
MGGAVLWKLAVLGHLLAGSGGSPPWLPLPGLVATGRTPRCPLPRWPAVAPLHSVSVLISYSLKEVLCGRSGLIFGVEPMDPLPGEDSAAPAIPPLRPGEKFHLFVSYSSVDAVWTHGLISRLEADLSGMKVCLHERDFTPGRNVLENMAECIQQSQKVLLMLSQDFVQSRWCLLEADLSLFGSCLERKPVIPVLLRPCQIPLHLSHLTYLNAADSCFYSKALQLLCTPNHLLARFPPALRPASSLYNGKTLLTLNCVNRDSLPSWKEKAPAQQFLVIAGNMFFCPLFMVLAVNTLCWSRRFSKKKMRELVLRVGEANLLLAQHSVLMGCDTANKLYFVHVLLEKCRQVFLEAASTGEGEGLFQEALLQFSCGYACCLAHAHFPHCEDVDAEGAGGHLELGLCFCQFVFLQLKRRGGVGSDLV